MDLLPAGVDPIGAASPTCALAAYMQVDSQPFAGNAGFGLLCENAPPSAVGVVVFGAPVPAGVPLFGVDTYVTPMCAQVVLSDARGFASLDLAVPATLSPPFGLAAQFGWFTNVPCASNLATASNALGF